MRHPLLYNPIRKPRLPIVLCHGLYGFDVRGPFLGLEYHYWSGALDVLRKKVGAEVLVHGVPPTGSIKERAESLHEFLCSSASGARGERLNFVGHSMGGLDVRYIISRIQPTEYTPASLTTLATPHRGSPFMDWCNSNIGIGLELIDKMMEESKTTTPMPPLPPLPYSLKEPLLRRREGIAKPKEEPNPVPGMSTLTRALTSVSSSLSSYILSIFDQPAYAMLSTKYMNRLFNPRTPDESDVRYFSIAARVKEVSVLHPLWLPKLILDKAAAYNTSGGQYDGSGDALHGKMHGNDGLVSVGSAQWGDFLGIMEGWDHWDVRGPGGPRRIRPASSKKTEQSTPPAPPTLGARWEALRGTISAWMPFGSKPKPEPAKENDDTYWNWLDAALSEYRDAPVTRSEENSEAPIEAAAYALASSRDKHGPSAHESELAHVLANWISSQLPARGDKTDPAVDQKDSKMLYMYLSQPRQPLLPAPNTPPEEAKKSKDWFHQLGDGDTAQALRTHLGWAGQKATEHLPKPAMTTSTAIATSVLEMFPFLLNHSVEEAGTPAHETFERFWLALCRNLYEEGL